MCGVDDLAVAFVNGNPVSALLTTTDLANVNSVASFGASSSIIDRSDALGRPLLSWPSRELLSVTDPTVFQGGLNQLVIAVHGDAASDATGVEFSGLVHYQITGEANDADGALYVNGDGFQNGGYGPFSTTVFPASVINLSWSGPSFEHLILIGALNAPILHPGVSAGCVGDFHLPISQSFFV